MELKDFLECMNRRETVEAGSEVFLCMHQLSQEAMKITAEMNSRYNTPEQLRAMFAKLTGRSIDDTFGLFPPFYTDCGKNIHLGRNVFINSGCHFQDQGGIYIGDGVLIGHSVTIATLNHDMDPEKRSWLHPQPVHLGRNVWIGSNATLLPGVSIGEGAVVSAGAVVSRDVDGNTVVGGVPARIIKHL